MQQRTSKGRLLANDLHGLTSDVKTLWIYEELKKKKCDSQAGKESTWTQLQAPNPGSWCPYEDLQEEHVAKQLSESNCTESLEVVFLQAWIPPAVNSWEVTPSSGAHNVCSIHYRNLYLFWRSFYQYLRYPCTADSRLSCWKSYSASTEMTNLKMGVNWPFVDSEH